MHILKRGNTHTRSNLFNFSVFWLTKTNLLIAHQQRENQFSYTLVICLHKHFCFLSLTGVDGLTNIKHLNYSSSQISWEIQEIYKYPLLPCFTCILFLFLELTSYQLWAEYQMIVAGQGANIVGMLLLRCDAFSLLPSLVLLFHFPLIKFLFRRSKKKRNLQIHRLLWLRETTTSDYSQKK